MINDIDSGLVRFFNLKIVLYKNECKIFDSAAIFRRVPI